MRKTSGHESCSVHDFNFSWVLHPLSKLQAWLIACLEFSGFSAGADMFSWNVAITMTSSASMPFENNENNAETVQTSVPVHMNSATDTSASSYEQSMQVRFRKVTESGSWRDGTLAWCHLVTETVTRAGATSSSSFRRCNGRRRRCGSTSWRGSTSGRGSTWWRGSTSWRGSTRQGVDNVTTRNVWRTGRVCDTYTSKCSGDELIRYTGSSNKS